MMSAPGLAGALRRPPLRRAIASLLLVTLFVSPYGVLAAPLPDAAAPAAQRPTVATVAGIPVVTITAPNAAGISHNKYTAFDVPRSGVVLNNATAATVSVLAGDLPANPNLGTTPARVIVNEVTGSASSLLAGPLEIAGNPATLILANPNGITCNGCGFINTPHVQLTTGRPQWDDEQLRFDVLDGVVSIGSAGLTALATRLDLIARSIVVAGPVAAGELNLLSGRAYVNSQTLAQQADPEHILASSFSSALPYESYLIDISQSLTAGTIRLAVSQDIYASSERGIRATAAVHADQDLVISGGLGMQLDDVSAGRNLAIFAPRLVDATVKRASAGDTLQVVADQLIIPEGGHWQAGNDIQIGNIGANSDHWGSFDNYGVVEAGRDLVLAFGAEGPHRNRGVLRAGRDVSGFTPPVASYQPDPDGGPSPVLVVSDTQASFELHPATQPQLLSMTGIRGRSMDTVIRGYGAIDNSRAGYSRAGRIEAGRDAHLIYGDRYTPSGPNGDGGAIVAGSDIHLWRIASPNAANVDIAPGFVTAGRDLWLHDLPGGSGGESIGLSNDRFSAGRDVLIAPTANFGDPAWSFTNPFQIRATQDIIVRTDAGFINAGGSLDAGRSIDIQAERFTNTAGVALSEGVSGSPRHPGCRTDNGGSCAYADETDRLPGSLTAGQDITISAGRFANIGASITAGGNIDLRTPDFSNRSRILSASWTSTYYEPYWPLLPMEYGSGSGSGSGSSAAVALDALPADQGLRRVIVSGTTPNIGEIPALIQAGGRFTVAGQDQGGGAPAAPGSGATPAASPPADPPPATRFINTGHIGAGVIVIRAEEIRNGYDPVADYYRSTALPAASPFTLNTAIDGGQLIADLALVFEAERVSNTGYIASGGLLAVTADSLSNGHRNAFYSEDRRVDGGTLHIRGDTVQPGGAMAAAAWDLQVDSLSSRSGEFIVLQDTPAATQAASSAFVAALAASLGANYHSEQAIDHLSATFEADEESGGWGSLIGMVAAVVVSYFTAGATSTLLAEMGAEAAGMAAADFAISGSVWVEGGLANLAVSQGLASLASSAAGQLVSTGQVDWGHALETGFSAGLTAGLSNLPLFDDQSLNQLAHVQTVAGNVVSASFDAERFASGLLGIAGRGVVAAGVNAAIAGSSFETALWQSVVNDLGAVGANAVGQTWDPLTPGNVLAHAGVGCAAAAAGGKDCAAGALGGAGAAVLNPLIDPLTSSTDSTARTVEHIAASMLATGALANTLGLDPLTAAGAAQNETVNNFLSPKAVDTIKRACLGAAAPTACQLTLANELNVSIDQRIANCRVQGNCGDLALAIQAGAQAITDAQADGSLTPLAAQAILAKQAADLNRLLDAMNLPKPDTSTLRTLFGVGLGALAVGACAVDLPACAALLTNAALRAATNPATPEIAATALCVAGGAVCPVNVAGVPTVVGVGVKGIPGFTGANSAGKLIGSVENLTVAEKSFVNEMVAGGKTVKIIPTSTGRTADFFIDGTRYELKTMSNVANQNSDGLSKALSSTIMDARGQSGNIVIDARGQAGMTAEIAERGIRRAFSADTASGSKIQSISIVTPQGTVYVPRLPQ